MAAELGIHLVTGTLPSNLHGLLHLTLTHNIPLTPSSPLIQT